MKQSPLLVALGIATILLATTATPALALGERAQPMQQAQADAVESSLHW